MKTALGLKLGQSLTMTPALQQAIRLLQLSSLDLQQEIQDALDSNLMLERSDEDDIPVTATAESTTEGEMPVADAAKEDIPAEPDMDFEWDDIYAGSGGSDLQAEEALYEFRQASLHDQISLQDHLQDQARLLPLTSNQAEAISYIIDAIDDRGYLRDWDDIAHNASSAADLGMAEIDALLTTVQEFDPPGVAARDLAECLRIQLAQLPADTAHLSLAQRLVDDHLEALADMTPERLARRLALGTQDLRAALGLIQSLQPVPGMPFQDHRSEYVVPDVFVARVGGRWKASLNPDIAPKLRINQRYQQLIKRADNSPDQQTMRLHLQEARYFLNSLNSRNDTMLRVAESIVEQQRAFLEYGDEAMKPLVLRDIAERLGIHESTVSRATANKYMHTPRGLYELKFFFSSSVRTTEGGSCSATAIQAMIRRLVGGEDPARPLSDSRLTQLLLEDGIRVARRTVAKYREGLGISPSHERRRMA